MTVVVVVNSDGSRVKRVERVTDCPRQCRGGVLGGALEHGGDLGDRDDIEVQRQ